MGVKKGAALFAAVIMLTQFFCGCRPEERTDWPEYTAAANEELGCLELSFGGIVFRPYGLVNDRRLLGAQIGIQAGDPDCKIYEVSGYDPDEWIIQHLDVFMSGNPFLLKATGVTDVPEALLEYHEYDY